MQSTGMPKAETFPSASRAAWMLVGFLSSLTLLVYAPVLSKLFHVWHSDEDMAHAMFVPIVVGYVIWQRREELGQLQPQLSRSGAMLCLLAAMVRVLSTLTGEVLLGRIALLCTLGAIVHLFFGMGVIRKLAFPIFLLLFSIPIPKVIYTYFTLSLQLIASALSELMLDSLGYTVLRNGNLLELAGQKLSVAEACSGIRSLFSLLFLVVTYLYFHEDRSWRRWLVLAATVPTAILVNALRIVVTGAVGEYDPVFALGLFHASAGWVLSLAGFVTLMVIHLLLHKVNPRRRVQ